jgi:hypothetical protein
MGSSMSHHSKPQYPSNNLGSSNSYSYYSYDDEEENNIVKKALLIGINYYDQEGELRGCINDSQNLKEFMKSHDYFSEEDFIMLNEDEDRRLHPTKSNILRYFDYLVSFSKKNKDKKVCLFVSYSGHGAFVDDIDGDEDDGKDEVLCPVDYAKNGFITDDVIKSRLIDKLPSNVTIFFMIDACHSGTMCDLKYNYALDKELSYTAKDIIPETACSVTMISGCRDDQTSADAYIFDGSNKHYEYQGAMSASFIANFTDEINYQDLINRMRIWLKLKKYTQVPQMSSGHYLNVTDNCLLTVYNNH